MLFVPSGGVEQHELHAPLMAVAAAPSPPAVQVRSLGAARLVPLVGAVGAIGTLVACYLIGVFVEGKTPWLLDITHYSKDPPAVFVFRTVLIPCCTLIAMTWLFAGTWMADLAALGAYGVESRAQKTKRALATTMGSVGAMCLVVSTAMEDGNDTQWTPHVICATSFFLLTVAAAVLTTSNLRDLAKNAAAPVNPSTLRTREILSGLGVAILVADALTSSPLLKDSVPEWTPHLCEWLATFDIIAFIGVFSSDWKGALTVNTAFRDHQM